MGGVNAASWVRIPPSPSRGWKASPAFVIGDPSCACAHVGGLFLGMLAFRPRARRHPLDGGGLTRLRSPSTLKGSTILKLRSAMRGLGPLVVLMAAIAWAAPVQAAPRRPRLELRRRRKAHDQLRSLRPGIRRGAPARRQDRGGRSIRGTTLGSPAICRAGRSTSSFSGDGKQTTDFAGGPTGRPASPSSRTAKIVVAGGSGDRRETLALARYLPGGAPDTSFSGDGKAERDFLNGDGCASGASIALQPNGRIVGALQSGAFCGYNVVRYLSNGNPDTSFSGDGAVTTNLGAGLRQLTRRRAAARRQDPGGGLDGRLHRLRPDPLPARRHPRRELRGRGHRLHRHRWRGRRARCRGSARRQDRRGRHAG